MTREKQQRLLASHSLLLAGDSPIETTLAQLIESGVGTITVLSEHRSLDLESDLAARPQNPDVAVSHRRMVRNQLDESVFDNVDLVVDGSLDWQFKMLISDLCMRRQLPLIHSGSTGLRFQLFTMVPGKSACLRCALPASGIDDFPLTPVTRDTFHSVAVCLGSLMALEAVKLLAELGVTQGNEFWKIDGLSGEIEIVRGLDPRLDCPDCGRAAL